MDITTVLVSAVVGAVTSAVTAYFTSKLKVSEEREKWSRDLSQKYAEALQTNPAVAANLAKQFAIALLIANEPQHSKEGRQKIFVLPNSRLVVGRGPESDIVVIDDRVSRRHAAFSTDGAHIFIESMGGRAGIFVNGDSALGRVLLHNGDTVSMGNTSFEVLMLS